MFQIRVVAAVMQNAKGQYLLAQRAQTDRYGAGLWEFPGGKVEGNETDTIALKREIKEELSLDILVGNLLATHIVCKNTKTYFILAYQATILAGNIMLTDHDAVEWVYANDILNFELVPADIDIWRQIAKNI
ncbi:MAG: (deoxy)nucleoside triphosphate pyrophosphohydrolase [Sphingobacteriales bacterium]|jgi:8-oxo-dGTP diphosphatase|nr:(deoxy)nucleoside triphosphate pyrophosphohydrolase [Sphingobacteriales bacterium]MBP9142211.1 (deoxy)nucleoside triphosphate pyrophosphohydrolase [Chitinophagales bacterium]MDA0199058.1 (deoxy)nucleoside triphosphate pyrophosphohydrolase [Bacteroidota bacterium]MBK6889670.1 (deoxy)nucleoside triphosphate pyrophosphohydrolase [Sphingobacteriales bacterium]MBK7527817.1 (deoxy)nucleoside triphosphate pyrophosphohydrolase [Sphingobacteriales bacterium]